MFKNSAVSTSKTELLVFITPRIMNERLTIR
jgi:type II secretory pathway component HofQ